MVRGNSKATTFKSTKGKKGKAKAIGSPSVTVPAAAGPATTTAPLVTVGQRSYIQPVCRSQQGPLAVGDIDVLKQPQSSPAETLVEDTNQNEAVEDIDFLAAAFAT